jgi:hypothetical protein
LPLTWPDWWPDWIGALDKTAVGPPFMVQTILDGARSRLAGRDVHLRAGDGDLRLHLDDLRFDLASLPLAVGQLGSIFVDARDVRWPGGQVDTLHVEFANVHIRPGFAPLIVSAPVRVHATIAQASLDGFLGAVADKVRVELGDGEARAYRPGRESWGHAAVTPRLEGDKVRLVATAISVRSRAFHAPGGGVPSVLVDLPDLPGGMKVTDLALGDLAVVVDARIDELREPVTAQQLHTIATLIRAGSGEIDLAPEPA